jgi:hypothetical protein
VRVPAPGRVLIAGARRRPVLAAAALYAALSLVFVGPALVPGRTLSNSDSLYFKAPWSASRPADLHRPAQVSDEPDWPLQYEPWLRYNRREFPDIPLWNPYLMAGRPYIGNAQSAAFSLFTLPTYLLPYDLANGLIAAFKLFAAAFGMFLLARSMALSWAGAVLGGLVFGFGMPLVTWLLELNLSAVWALIPWLLLATRNVVARSGLLPVCGLAVTAAAVFFAAHPESIIQAFAGALAFLVLQIARKPRQSAHRGRGWAGDAARFAGGVLWGAAIAAVAIGPFVELLAHSSDLAERGAAVHGAFDLRFAITLTLPDYWGRGTGFVLAPALGRFLYIGALPLMLAAIALLRPTVERAACAIFWIACLAVVFGVSPIVDLVNLLPGLSKTDNTRLIIVALPALALLAGWGLDDLRGILRGRRQSLAPLATATVLLFLPLIWLAERRPPISDLLPALKVAWLFGTPPPSVDVLRLATLLLWLTMAGVGVVLIALRVRGRMGSTAFVTLALTLVAVDLFRAGVGFNPAISQNHARPPTTGAIRFLQSQRPARYVAIDPAMPGDLAMTYGLYDAGGYDFPVDLRYHRFWLAEINPGMAFFPGHSLAHVVGPINPSSLRGLGLLGVANILAPNNSPLRSKDLTVAYRGPDATVYANRGALPRTFVVSGRRIVAGDDAALAAVTSPSFDARRTLIQEGSGSSTPPGAPAGRARIISYEPDRVVISATAARPATVVLSDLWFQGWNAKVDGAAVDVARVDYLLRGVHVGRGAHRIVFSYQPASWRFARLLTGLAIVALAAAVAITLLRRRIRTA